MTTVAIAEDQLLMLSFLADIINGFEGFRVTAQAGDGAELIEQLRDTGSPDLLLLDYNMPVMDGEQVAIWMREHHPSTKVVILTSYYADVVKVRLLRTGIRGLLNKNIKPKDLEKALNGVKHQNAYFLHEDVDRLIVLLQQVEDGTTTFDRITLTDRELEYIRLCCTELKAKDIAGKMGVSPRTIQNIADSIYAKIGIRTRLGLAMYAVTNGLVYLEV